MSENIELSPEYYRGYHIGFREGISSAYEQFGPLIAAAQNPAPVILQGVALSDIKEALQNSTQQLKPKMPSYDAVEAEFNSWWQTDGQGVQVSYRNMRKFFDIVVRHFGH